MGLLTGTQQDYYNGQDGVPNSQEENLGGYQFISLSDIIDNFTATYVGKGKLLAMTNRADISFHAHRALQELSFDTFKSCKTQEIELPASLTMPIPHDYVNYVKLTWTDGKGVEHIIYPGLKTSNPHPVDQDSDGDYIITTVGYFTSTNLGEIILPGDLILDGEYPNITIGMVAKGALLEKDNLTVSDIFTDNGVTNIRLVDSDGNPYSDPHVGTNSFTVYFSPKDGSILQQEDSSLVLTNVHEYSYDNAIFQSPTVESDIKIGMMISNVDWQEGTYVIDIGPEYTSSGGRTGRDIFLSTNRLSSSPTYDHAYFTSYEHLSDTWSNYKTNTPSENVNLDYDTRDDRFGLTIGQRYGIEPQHAQVNGSYFIDCKSGKIHFSSNLSGKIITLKYISDSLGTDGEMQVHKLAEEAMYKWIAYGCLTAIMGVPEYVINRFKREKISETRKAKIRLSNIKIEEITQVLRGRSKWIKH
mgnify:CR=1 FL=1|tara:strand:- start:17194 stop:18609 length:1416 start_codon:yes stop_codon:yes gene_type:complete